MVCEAAPDSISSEIAKPQTNEDEEPMETESENVKEISKTKTKMETAPIKDEIQEPGKLQISGQSRKS